MSCGFKNSVLKLLTRLGVIAFVIIVSLIMAGACLILFIWFMTPDVSWFGQNNPTRTAMMRFNEDACRKSQQPHEIQYYFVSLFSISRNLQEAVLLAEDNIFFRHKGFNWESIKVAARSTLKHRKFIRGGSTITQQLAKNLFLKPSPDLLRKVREAFIAIKLEKVLSKTRILELYLNIVEWGRGIYGAEAAARFYYGKHASELSLEESIRMASILPNPQKFPPGEKSPLMDERRLRIARKLHASGSINTRLYQELRHALQK